MGKLQLKINSKAFATAKEKLAEYGEDVRLEPGRYEGQIVDVRAPKANLVCLDIKEKDTGGRVTIMFSTEEERLVYLLQTLSKFGLQPSDGDEIVQALEELKSAKPEIMFSVKEKDGYSNIRIEKMTGEGGDESAVDEDAGKKTAGAKKDTPKAAAGKSKLGKKATPPAAEEEVVEEEEAVEEEEPVAEEEEVDIKPGLKLKATIQGEEGVKCEIVEVFEADEKVTVKRLSDGKKFKIPADRLSL